MYDHNNVRDDKEFWKQQAKQNANEIASLRQALRTEREVRASYRSLLDCYEIALHAFVEVDK